MKKSSMWKSSRRENEKFQNTFEKLKNDESFKKHLKKTPRVKNFLSPY